TAGTRVGPYEIRSRIGAGGMGEVWSARDGRLQRDVAIKVLPELVARDTDRLHRFEIEARAAGALNHPNLVTIYDVGTHDNTAYVVMELLEGETLRDKIGDGLTDESGPRIPIRKAIEYAGQIANGLSAAHEKGIVHRDLKPENVFITSDGRLKILDFGLAKLTSPEQSDATIDRTEQRGTAPGMVVGTAGYMSPEQVRGQTVDHRTDIFSFGAVLYEMLAGRRAFRRDSAVETMNAVLKEDPPELEDARTPVAPGVERIVRRCLEKTPAERFQSAHDIAFALDAVASTSTHHAVLDVPGARGSRSFAIGAGVLVSAAIAGFIGWRIGHRSAAAPPAARSFVQLTFSAGEEFPSLSPDGKTFVFAGKTANDRVDIYTQRVDGRNAINLTKDAAASSWQPAFSPDGNQIVFRSNRDGGGLFIMGATGESVRKLCDTGFNPAWSPDGKEIAANLDDIEHLPRARSRKGPLLLIDAQSGAKRELLDADVAQPAWSPHGNRIAFWGIAGQGGQRDLWTVDPHAPKPEQTLVRLTNDVWLDWSPVWSNDGKWLYFSSDRDGTTNLWRLPMDEASGKATGAPEPLTLPARFAGHFSVARNTGDLAFVAFQQTENVWLVPFDAATVRMTGEPQRIRAGAMIQPDAASPSPDGESWVFQNVAAQEDLYITKRDGSGLRQITNDPPKDRGPAFSADGTHIYFYSQRGERYEIYSIRPDGSELKKISTTTGRSIWYPQPFPGRNALMTFNESGVYICPFNADGTITCSETLPPIRKGVSLFAPELSSDGSMLAGIVREPLAFSGTWTYSFATKSYQRINDSTNAPRWIPHSNHEFIAATPKGVAVTDIARKTSRETRLPMSVTLFNISPDGKFLMVNEDQE